jgi:hypothetical protein
MVSEKVSEKGLAMECDVASAAVRRLGHPAPHWKSKSGDESDDDEYGDGGHGDVVLAPFSSLSHPSHLSHRR